jgi:LPXTG-motif cell wall-anchored protein
MALVVACIAASVAFLATPAAAQTGYPPGPCVILSGSQFAGNAAVGQTFTVTVSPACLFTPGGVASIVANGGAPFTKVVNPDGTVTLTITVLSTTQLSINPVVPAVCGVNTVSVSSPSSVAGGQTVTQTVTFNLVCPGQGIEINICNAGDGGAGGVGIGTGGNANTSGGTATGGAGSGTGGAGGSGGDACNVTLTGASGGGSGGGGGAGGAAKPGLLARTGAAASQYAAVAGALVVAGALLVLGTRRRRSER